MKVEKKEAKFEPVTMTFESQDELDLFFTVFRRIGGNEMLRIFGNRNYVCRALEKMGAKELGRVVFGDIRLD